MSVRVHSASFDSVDSRLKSSEASIDGEENDGTKKKKKKKKLFFFKKKPKVTYLFSLMSWLIFSADVCLIVTLSIVLCTSLIASIGVHVCGYVCLPSVRLHVSVISG